VQADGERVAFVVRVAEVSELRALTIAEAGPAASGFGLHRIPVYDVRLVQSRHPLMLPLPYRLADNPDASAQAFHTLIGLTDREHLACLFVNAQHEINGAHVAAMGGQSRINAIDARVIFRAALAACAAGIVLGHYVPRHIMPVLFPLRLCLRSALMQPHGAGSCSAEGT
jgi:RadC-like JAB domain